VLAAHDRDLLVSEREDHDNEQSLHAPELTQVRHVLGGF